jgi:aspartate racemase
MWNVVTLVGYVFNNQLDKLVDFLIDKINILESSGVDYGAIASNTPHIVFDKLIERAAIPLISIVEETCKVISNKKLRRVGLFGTKSTMTNGFYNKVAAKYRIDILVPELDKKDPAHNIG